MRASLAWVVMLICGAAAADVSTPEKSLPVRSPPPTDCEPKDKRVVAIDVNGGGKPDVWKLYSARVPERILCKKVELNRDGKIDMLVYYDATGDAVLETFDLDFDGKIDQWTWYHAGQVVRQDLDLDFDGKADVRKYYQEGKVTRTERAGPGGFSD